MKKIITAILCLVCLSFFVLCGSVRADKKYQVLLKYKDGKLSKAVNNCRSEKGRLQPTTKIVNGTARVKVSGPNTKKVKLRSISKGVIVDEVEFSFEKMRVMYDSFGNEGITGYQEPTEEMTFFAEIPYKEGTIEKIEIVNDEVVEEVMDVSIFVDESDDSGRLLSGCDIDLVILPDRYGEWYGEVYVCTPENLSRFREEAVEIRDYVENKSPFNEFPDKITWYWPISVAQMTDQGSEPNPEDPSDVCGGVSIWEAGCVPCHAREQYHDYDEVYVLINEPLYRKGAARKVCPLPDADLSVGKHTFSWGTNYLRHIGAIAAHELGHSGIGLDDEYVYNSPVTGNPLIATWPIWCQESNCCDDCDQIVYADCNKDGNVDLWDLVIMIVEYGRYDCFTTPCLADCNEDGCVDLEDLIMMKIEFGETTSTCYWDLRPGCEGCRQGCTYANRYRCDLGCMMRAVPDEFCKRCKDLIRVWLEQCFDF